MSSDDRNDERVRRRGEQRARLSHAAQVAREQQDDHADPDRHDVGRE